KVINIAGKPRNLRGSLTSADLKITMTLPHNIKESCLSAMVEDTLTLSSNETSIRIGCNSLPDADGCVPCMAPEDSKKTYTIVVPLVRGDGSRKPLLDRIHSTEEEILHHTVSIPGVSWPD